MTTNVHLNKALEMFEAIDFSKLIVSDKHDEYSLDNEHLQCQVLFRDAGAEVMHCIAKPGCKTEAHTHKQREHYLLYEGEGCMKTETETINLTDANSPNIAAGIVHWLESEKGCKLFIARIPSIPEAPYE